MHFAPYHLRRRFKAVMPPELPAVRDRAFTLVEVLVVIGIIAILIAILLPGLMKARRQAVSLQCQSNLRQLLIAAQAYANDNNGIMPGFDSNYCLISPGNWCETLAKYVAPPDYNASDPNHNWVAVYNCPACGIDLIQSTGYYPSVWNDYPVTYAISWFASDTAQPLATHIGHWQAYWCTKYNQWYAPNFILFADNFPLELAVPNGLHWGGTLGEPTIARPWGLAFAYSVAFYHGSGDWIFAAAHAPTRTNAGFLDGHVESMTAEDFMRDYLSKENLARCPTSPEYPAVENDGSQYINLLPPYGKPSLYYP